MAIRDYMSKPSSGVKAGNRGAQARAGGAGDMVGQKRKRDEAAAAKKKAAAAKKSSPKKAVSSNHGGIKNGPAPKSAGGRPAPKSTGGRPAPKKGGGKMKPAVMPKRRGDQKPKLKKNVSMPKAKAGNKKRRRRR